MEQVNSGFTAEIKADIGDGYSLTTILDHYDLEREPAHWWLCKDGLRISRIWVTPRNFDSIPAGLPAHIVSAALEATERFSRQVITAYNNARQKRQSVA